MSFAICDRDTERDTRLRWRSIAVHAHSEAAFRSVRDAMLCAALHGAAMRCAGSVLWLGVNLVQISKSARGSVAQALAGLVAPQIQIAGSSEACCSFWAVDCPAREASQFSQVNFGMRRRSLVRKRERRPISRWTSKQLRTHKIQPKREETLWLARGLLRRRGDL